MSKAKPKMNSKQLVEKMIDKGITISPYSKESVEEYLLSSNNFLRLCSYRKLFPKHKCGKNAGKYINLSFDQLKALAILDMKLRKYILSMCIDIEHGLKVKLLRDFEQSDNDGYSIVQDFFKTKYGAKIAKNIIQKHTNIYINCLANKYIYEKENDNVFYIDFYKHSLNKTIAYNVDLPIWSMLEMITFGEFLHFYSFYYDKSIHPDSPVIPIQHKILMNVKNMRNACAHNNCILTNLTDKSAKVKPNIKQYISDLDIGIADTGIKKKLKCKVINEIICVFYSLDKVSSTAVTNHDYNELSLQMHNYQQKYMQLFDKNNLILTSFEFLQKTVDKLKEIWYNKHVI